MNFSQSSAIPTRDISAKALFLCLALYTLLQCVNAVFNPLSSLQHKHSTPIADKTLAYTSRYLRINEYLFTGVDSKTYVA